MMGAIAETPTLKDIKRIVVEDRAIMFEDWSNLRQLHPFFTIIGCKTAYKLIKLYNMEYI